MNPEHSHNSGRSSPWRTWSLAFTVIPVLLTCLAFSPAARAQSPTPGMGVYAYHSETNEDNANTYGPDFYIIGVFILPYPVGPLTVNYQMSGTALNGIDYEAVSGTAVYTV